MLDEGVAAAVVAPLQQLLVAERFVQRIDVVALQVVEMEQFDKRVVVQLRESGEDGDSSSISSSRRDAADEPAG